MLFSVCQLCVGPAAAGCANAHRWRSGVMSGVKAGEEGKGKRTCELGRRLWRRQVPRLNSRVRMRPNQRPQHSWKMPLQGDSRSRGRAPGLCRASLGCSVEPLAAVGGSACGGS